jgi:antitoxin ParD1/3/4
MKAMTLNVRVGGVLGEHVAGKVGEHGDYENVSEYVRDLIRRDRALAEAEAFARLKAELARAFEAPETDYAPLRADDVIARHATPGA